MPIRDFPTEVLAELRYKPVGKTESYGDVDHLELVVGEEVLDGTRWGTKRVIVFKHLADGTFWRAVYEVGSGDSEYDELHESEVGPVFNCVEVEPLEVTTTVWEVVE